jgi:hypothetical protein
MCIPRPWPTIELQSASEQAFYERVLLQRGSPHKHMVSAMTSAQQEQEQQPARPAHLRSRPGRRRPQQRAHLERRRRCVPGQERAADGLQAAPVDGRERHVARHGRACRPAKRCRSCLSQYIRCLAWFGASAGMDARAHQLVQPIMQSPAAASHQLHIMSVVRFTLCCMLRTYVRDRAALPAARHLQPATCNTWQVLAQLNPSRALPSL